MTLRNIRMSHKMALIHFNAKKFKNVLLFKLGPFPTNIKKSQVRITRNENTLILSIIKINQIKWNSFNPKIEFVKNSSLLKEKENNASNHPSLKQGRTSNQSYRNLADKKKRKQSNESTKGCSRRILGQRRENNFQNNEGVKDRFSLQHGNLKQRTKSSKAAPSDSVTIENEDLNIEDFQTFNNRILSDKNKQTDKTDEALGRWISKDQVKGEKRRSRIRDLSEKLNRFLKPQSNRSSSTAINLNHSVSKDKNRNSKKVGDNLKGLIQNMGIFAALRTDVVKQIHCEEAQGKNGIIESGDLVDRENSKNRLKCDYENGKRNEDEENKRDEIFKNLNKIQKNSNLDFQSNANSSTLRTQITRSRSSNHQRVPSLTSSLKLPCNPFRNNIQNIFENRKKNLTLNLKTATKILERDPISSEMIKYDGLNLNEKLSLQKKIINKLYLNLKEEKNRRYKLERKLAKSFHRDFDVVEFLVSHFLSPYPHRNTSFKKRD